MFEPAVAAVYIALMWQLVGVEVLLGFAVIYIFIFLQLCIARCAGTLRRLAS